MTSNITTDKNNKNTIKFRPDQLVKISISSSILHSVDTDKTTCDILIENVVDRHKEGYCTYRVVLPNELTQEDVLCKLVEVIPEKNIVGGTELFINFSDFKRLFQTFKVTELTDRFRHMTEECLLRDLEFMQEEIVTVKIRMNMLKQTGDMKRYTFYDDLITNRLHDMFQLPSNESYVKYVSKITELIKSDKIQSQFKNEIEKMIDSISSSSLVLDGDIE